MDCKGTKAKPLWQRAAALSIEDQPRVHNTTQDYEPGPLALYLPEHPSKWPAWAALGHPDLAIIFAYARMGSMMIYDP